MKDSEKELIDHLDSLNLEPERPNEEWLIQRLGKLTGSQIPKIVKRTKDKKGWQLSDGMVCDNLLYRIAWERFLTVESEGLNRLSVNSKPIEHGVDYEAEGIAKYEEVQEVEVNRTQVYHTLTDYFGGTPDGFIGEEGMVEVKCPWNGGNHLKTLFTGEIYNPEFYIQIQSYLLITGRKWCDFVTYDPDMPEGLNISINRIERDEELIEAIKEIVDQAEQIIKEIVNNLKERSKK